MQTKFVESKRLILRPYQTEDWERVHVYGADPDFSKYEPWGPNTEEDTKKFIAEMVKQSEQTDCFKFEFAVTLKESGFVIGGCGIRKDAIDGDTASLGWAITPEFQKRGYATEVGEALINFGFRTIGLRLIYATCDTLNTASFRVMEKLHMKRVAHIQNDKWMKNRMRDTFRYEIERDDRVALLSYENLGETYARNIETNAYNAGFERPNTLSLLPDLKGKRVLDAGCGPGAYVEELLKRGASVVGVDVTPKMIELARERYGTRAEFHVHDLGLGLQQFTDQSFDFVLSSLTIHYIKDQLALFKEFARLLKPSGKMVLSTHLPQTDFADSPSGDYFSTELLAQDWRFDGKSFRVRFYRRPLSQTFGAIHSAGFRILDFHEGRLTTEFEQKFPAEYARIKQNPPFMFLSLQNI